VGRRGFLAGAGYLFASLALGAACAPSEGGRPSPQVPVATPPVATGPTPTPQPGSGIIVGSHGAEANRLNGAGATFPAALYSKWFNDYYGLTGVQINYQAIGSGAGIKGVTDGTIDFGATDSPMTDQQLAATPSPILHIPTTIGAVVAIYNVPGVDVPLKIAPDVLADIFMGKIRVWNDPRLQAENPDVDLPNRDIIVVHRSDASGTTFIWVDYLTKVSPEWAATIGRGTAVRWPVGLGSKGNQGVAGEVKNITYAIGYVELIFARHIRLPMASLRNRAGQYVAPGPRSVSAAAEGIAQTIAPDLRASIVDAPGDSSYPVSSFTWILAYENMTDRARAIALTRMLWWATHDGQRYSADLGYAPLPRAIVERAEEKILQIKVNGEQAFPGA
jgi:phosphate transport system substrate-binding protein